MAVSMDLSLEISKIVAATVVETFNGMFGQSVVTATVDRTPPGDKGMTSACLILTNDDGPPAGFYFTFDDRMLALTAREFFAAEMSEDQAIRNDIACAVANIVGTKVKNCLNANGYKFEMTLPYAIDPSQMEIDRNALHMHFAYNDRDGRMTDGGVMVNFMIKGERTGTNGFSR